MHATQTHIIITRRRTRTHQTAHTRNTTNKKQHIEHHYIKEYQTTNTTNTTQPQQSLTNTTKDTLQHCNHIHNPSRITNIIYQPNYNQPHSHHHHNQTILWELTKFSSLPLPSCGWQSSQSTFQHLVLTLAFSNMPDSYYDHFWKTTEKMQRVLKRGFVFSCSWC